MNIKNILLNKLKMLNKLLKKDQKNVIEKYNKKKK